MKKNNFVICGGGSTYTLSLIKTLCDFADKLNIGKVTLFDIDRNKQQPISDAASIMTEELLGSNIIEQTYDIKQAFHGADFVFIQIRSGGLEMREQDEKIPLKHGCLGQETCGAGGFAYGMRSVPEVVEIIKEVRQQSPEAWIINYSNPAAIVAEATKRIFPDDIRLINLCDMPIAIIDGIARMLGKKPSDLYPRYYGLNHFGWFTHLYSKSGTDYLPHIRAALAENIMIPNELVDDEDWVKTFEMQKKAVRDIDDGCLPNTYLQYYYYPKTVAESQDKEYTRANQVIDNRLKKVEDMCDFITSNGTINGSGLEEDVHGLYIVELAEAIITNSHRQFIALVKNDGIISNLSDDAVVEVPCLVSCNGLKPLSIGKIDKFHRALLENQYTAESLIVDAILNQDYNAALKALVLNRAVGDVDVAKALLDELMEANKGYWKLNKK